MSKIAAFGWTVGALVFLLAWDALMQWLFATPVDPVLCLALLALYRSYRNEVE